MKAASLETTPTPDLRGALTAQTWTARPEGQRSARERAARVTSRVTASDASTEISIPLTFLTEEGNLIVGLLDRATSLAGMCTGASRFDPEKFATQIWARFEPSKKPWFDPAEMHEITSLCEPS